MTFAEEVKQKIDGLEARQALSKEALGHLSALYNSIWAEVCYDPASEATRRFATYLLPHIKALNDELKFRT